MARLSYECFRCCLPLFPYELRWREPLECFEPSRVVVGVDEERKVCPELVMVVVVVAFDVQRENDLLDRFLVRFTFFDRAVHALHLTAFRGKRFTGPFLCSSGSKGGSALSGGVLSHRHCRSCQSDGRAAVPSSHHGFVADRRIGCHCPASEWFHSLRGG